MKKYYTRACNFYYGINAKLLIKKKLALPLCGNKNIAFDRVEVISRKNNKILSKIINIKKIETLNSSFKRMPQLPRLEKRLRSFTIKYETLFDLSKQKLLTSSRDFLSDLDALSF